MQQGRNHQSLRQHRENRFNARECSPLVRVLNPLSNNHSSRRGYAFIDYFSPADADFGIKHLHGIKFKGKKITAEFARRRRRMGTSSTITTTTTTSTHTHSQSFDNDDDSTSGPAVICYRCGTEGHRSSECAEVFGITWCFCCGSANHHISINFVNPTDTVHVDPVLLIAARDPEITRLVPEATTTTADIMVPILAFTDPGLAKTVTATTTPWINPKLILLPIPALNLTMRGDDTTLEPSLPLLGTIMMIPIQPLRYHYTRHFHRILGMFQVGSKSKIYSLLMLAPPKADLLKHDRSSYDNKSTQRSISPSYHSPPQHTYEDVDGRSAHSRGYSRSKGHRSQTNSGRQNSDPDSASDVDRYTGNYREERSTTAHRYYSRSLSPRRQAPRRNTISGDHEYYYSRDFFEASVPQGAYHY
ncbi:hypothetical protein F5876DRAFT_67538 [Lentinula aff. lateritia]|uniref:Uncharacterized protein n=1 Tax=Lentinula aff. lateritia TaxID=2804960 RepID=A0ACC1TU72_9AGAR|nr:hypothetical protein F5876DRAFT_67538 [Lentinula aff. lateritia]